MLLLEHAILPATTVVSGDLELELALDLDLDLDLDLERFIVILLAVVLVCLLARICRLAN